MKKLILILFALFITTVAFSQENYYEVNKLHVKNPDGTTSIETHEIALIINKKNKTCSVRIDYKEPQIFKITSEKKNVQTTVKTYELLHKDGRKITLSIKNGQMTVIAHKTGKKYETHIDYSRSEGK